MEANAADTGGVAGEGLEGGVAVDRGVSRGKGEREEGKGPTRRDPRA